MLNVFLTFIKSVEVKHSVDTLLCGVMVLVAQHIATKHIDKYHFYNGCLNNG